MTDIIIDAVSVRFGEKQVLERLSGTIPGGKTTVIMGPSGCGKTTVLRVLMGFVKPDSGEVRNVPGRISAVFQENRLCGSFSPVKNVAMVLPRHFPEAEIRRNLSEAGLSDSLDLPVKSLSGGMKRRVAIVRAMLADSELLLLDEPFRELDEERKKSMMEYVRKASRGKTAVMVTHDPEEASAMADVIWEL